MFASKARAQEDGLLKTCGTLNYVAPEVIKTKDNGEDFANWGNPAWFSWDNKLAGIQVLLSKVSFFGRKGVSSSANSDLEQYRKTADAVICGLLTDSPTATSSRTDVNPIQ